MSDKTFSLNDTVYFRITKAGHRTLADNATAMHKEFPYVDQRYRPSVWKRIDDIDWYQAQLHWFLQEFGSHCLRFELPVTHIMFEEPTPTKRDSDQL